MSDLDIIIEVTVTRSQLSVFYQFEITIESKYRYNCTVLKKNLKKKYMTAFHNV